jgi:hypothetical protein
MLLLYEYLSHCWSSILEITPSLELSNDSQTMIKKVAAEKTTEQSPAGGAQDCSEVSKD